MAKIRGFIRKDLSIRTHSQSTPEGHLQINMYGRSAEDEVLVCKMSYKKFSQNQSKDHPICMVSVNPAYVKDNDKPSLEKAFKENLGDVLIKKVKDDYPQAESIIFCSHKSISDLGNRFGDDLEQCPDAFLKKMLLEYAAENSLAFKTKIVSLQHSAFDKEALAHVQKTVPCAGIALGLKKTKPAI